MKKSNKTLIKTLRIAAAQAVEDLLASETSLEDERIENIHLQRRAADLRVRMDKVISRLTPIEQARYWRDILHSDTSAVYSKDFMSWTESFGLRKLDFCVWILDKEEADRKAGVL